MSIGIVGLGYVGLPLAVAYAEEGHDVVALDVDSRKIEAIREGRSYVEDIASERLQAVVDRIRPTTRPAALAGTDAIVICVPTPLTAQPEPDLRPPLDAGQAVARVLPAGPPVLPQAPPHPGPTPRP